MKTEEFIEDTKDMLERFINCTGICDGGGIMLADYVKQYIEAHMDDFEKAFNDGIDELEELDKLEKTE